MAYNLAQLIIEGTGAAQIISLRGGAVKIRISGNPNDAIKFAFDSKDDKGIYLSRTGSYEIDLRGISIISQIYFINLPKGSKVIIDYLSEML